MADVIYVNFSTGEASYVGYSTEPIIVGPVFSMIDGKPYITVSMSLEEIKSLREPQYQQLQITDQR